MASKRKYSPQRDKVISVIQVFLMLYAMIVGFFFTYLLIWFKCGLPQEWWAFPITIWLGFLTTGVLCHWIGEGGADNENL